jgi:hypothetical protein
MRKIVTEQHVRQLVKDWFKARNAFRFSVVQNGLGIHGIHDDLGMVPIAITPEMVGKTIALSVTVESKKPGRRGEKDRGMSKHQILFQEGVIAAGGLSICCDGEDDLRQLDHLLWELTHVAKP